MYSNAINYYIGYKIKNNISFVVVHGNLDGESLRTYNTLGSILSSHGDTLIFFLL